MVQNWGTGRKDWSKNTELATVPFGRSHQARAFATTTSFDLTPYGIYTIDNEAILGTIGIWLEPAEFIAGLAGFDMFSINVTYNANVLVKAYMTVYNMVTGEYDRKQVGFDFGKMQFNFPKGYLLTLEQMQQNWVILMEFLPGGYVISLTAGGMSDKYVA